jgi:hypothetical protein
MTPEGQRRLAAVEAGLAAAHANIQNEVVLSVYLKRSSFGSSGLVVLTCSRLRRCCLLFPGSKIVDLGAMNPGDGSEPYAPLLKATPCDVIGFEPVGAEYDKLRRDMKQNDLFLPYFIRDGSRRIFYERNFSMTSSLFEPNKALLAKFQNLEGLVHVVNVLFSRLTSRRSSLHELDDSDSQLTRIRYAHQPALRRLNALRLAHPQPP